MSQTMLTSRGISALLERASQTCFRRPAPTSALEWATVLNYVALNVEEPAAFIWRIMQAVSVYSGQNWPEQYLQRVFLGMAYARRKLFLAPRPGEDALRKRFAEAINRWNRNRAAEDLICENCGAQDCWHDPEEDHPGVFDCRACHRRVCA